MNWIVRMHRNATIGTKLRVGFVVLSVFVVAMGATGLLSIRSVNRYLEQFGDRSLPVVQKLLQIDRDYGKAIFAERTLLFVSTKSDDFQLSVRNRDLAIQSAKKSWESYLDLAGELGELEETFSAKRDEWLKASSEAVAARAEDTREGRRLSIDLSLNKSEPLFQEMRLVLDQLTQRQVSQVRVDRESSESVSASAMAIFAGIAVLAFLVAILMGVVLTRIISTNLGNIASGLSQASGLLVESSARMKQESSSLADGASRQASSIQESNASIQELCSWTERTIEDAQRTEQAISLVVESVHQAHGHTDRLTASMDSIRSASMDTQKIAQVIDEIAFQTNILALNAAVEAARAGSAGAGFAVVADEVRSLAHRVAKSSRETQSLIESVITRVEEGNEASQGAHESINDINEKMQDASSRIQQICKATNEQSSGISQIQSAIQQIDHEIQQTASVADSSAHHSEEIHREANDMNKYIMTLDKLIGHRSSATANRKTEHALPRRAHLAMRAGGMLNAFGLLLAAVFMFSGQQANAKDGEEERLHIDFGSHAINDNWKTKTSLEFRFPEFDFLGYTRIAQKFYYTVNDRWTLGAHPLWERGRSSEGASWSDTFRLDLEANPKFKFGDATYSMRNRWELRWKEGKGSKIFHRIRHYSKVSWKLSEDFPLIKSYGFGNEIFFEEDKGKITMNRFYPLDAKLKGDLWGSPSIYYLYQSKRVGTTSGWNGTHIMGLKLKF